MKEYAIVGILFGKYELNRTFGIAVTGNKI
jgi:hypothetical protein